MARRHEMGDKLEENDTKKAEVIAYLMTFALKSYESMEKQDANALLDFISACADDILAFKDGKPLSGPSFSGDKAKNGKWKVI